MGNDGGNIGKNYGGGATGDAHRALTTDAQGNPVILKEMNSTLGFDNVTKQDEADYIKSGGRLGRRNDGASRAKLADQSQSQIRDNLTAKQRKQFNVRQRFDNRPQEGSNLTGTRTMTVKPRQLAAAKRAMRRSFRQTPGSGNNKAQGTLTTTAIRNRAGKITGYKLEQRMGNSAFGARRITRNGVDLRRTGELRTAAGVIKRGLEAGRRDVQAGAGQRVRAPRASGRKPKPRPTQDNPGTTAPPRRARRTVPLSEQQTAASRRRGRSAQR